MRPPDGLWASVQEWMGFAARDLQAAEILLATPGQESNACFLAQQAAEKALKAYLVALGEGSVPRTHDLWTLAGLVHGRGGVAPPDACLAGLDQFAVTPRYPGAEAATHDTAEAAVGSARAVVEHVLAQLPAQDEEQAGDGAD